MVQLSITIKQHGETLLFDLELNGVKTEALTNAGVQSRIQYATREAFTSIRGVYTNETASRTY